MNNHTDQTSDAINFLKEVPPIIYFVAIVILVITGLSIYFYFKNKRESDVVYENTLLNPVPIDDSHVGKKFIIKETVTDNPTMACIEEVVWIHTGRNSFKKHNDKDIYAKGYFKDVDHQFWTLVHSIEFPFVPEEGIVFEVLREKSGYCAEKVTPELAERQEEFAH